MIVIQGIHLKCMHTAHAQVTILYDEFKINILLNLLPMS